MILKVHAIRPVNGENSRGVYRFPFDCIVHGTIQMDGWFYVLVEYPVVSDVGAQELPV